jgi:hypothetical protein
MHKATSTRTILIATATLFITSPLAYSQQNIEAIALLRWYAANTTTQFPVGAAPLSAAFDGANIWVVNESGSVTKLQAATGANLGTFALGGSPVGIAFDGANIWVSSENSNTIT